MARAKGYLPSPSQILGLGALKGLELTAGPLPDQASELLPPAWEQSFQDCVANAGEVALRHGQWVQLGRPPATWPEPGSRAWIYAVTRMQAGQSLEDDFGTYIHALFEAVAKIGFPKETQYTYGPHHLKVKPEWNDIRESADQTFVAGARRIVSTGYRRVLDVAVAIASGSVVVWGTVLDAPFEQLGPTDVWPGVMGPEVGGHAMVLHGFRKTAAGRLVFSSRSSWGPGYADAGSAWVDEDAIASPNAQDFWLVENAPVFSGTE